MGTASTQGNDGDAASATRVLDVLEVLAAAPGPIGASELARRLSFPKSSTHKLLSALERRGYLVGDASRRFQLHPMYSRGRHGWVGGPIAAVRQLAEESMRRLAVRSGESVFLGVLRDRDSFEYVEKIVSGHEVRCDAELGTPRALHGSSVGLVLLAFADERRFADYLDGGRLPSLTPNTLADRSRLSRELAKVRRQGFAVTRDTNAVGASGIAAPILGPHGTALAGLNISAPTARFEVALERASKDLLQAAHSISAALQGRP